MLTTANAVPQWMVCMMTPQRFLRNRMEVGLWLCENRDVAP